MRTLKPLIFLSVCLLVLLGWSGAWADDLDTIARGAGDKPADAKADKKKDKQFPDFDEVVTDDFEKIRIYVAPEKEPFYTLYYSEKADQLLAEIPGSQLGKDFMISTSISAAPSVAGWMWGDQVVKWEKREKKLLLIEPDFRNEGKKGNAISDAVARTYTDRILETVDIRTMNGGNPVIDLGQLFKNDFGGIGRVLGGSLDSGLARWLRDQVKCFDQNIVLSVESPLQKSRGSGSGTLIVVKYSISGMPDTGYKPRRADDRIGYFTTVRRDWGKDYKAKTLFDRYINRWHLEKVDPTLAKSPVKNPIVFYVEKTVPVQYRDAVKRGVLEWNKAFERCGFIDAIQVRQQTDSNEFKDYDPEDVTKNFIRWTATGVGLAVGPSRANPYTGQIYDADVVFDDGWVRGMIERHGLFGAKSLSAVTSNRKLESFLKAHPAFDIVPRHKRLAPDYVEEETQPDEILPDYNLLDGRYRYYMCDCGANASRQLGLARCVFNAMGYKEIPEEFLQQLVQDVITHEVGHTLGLRHNFKASTMLPLEDVLRPSEEIRPIGASVMDYNAFMFHWDKEKQGDVVMRTIGPYDEWAIEYGYKPVEDPYKNEEELLKSITDRVAEAGLDYATDEDTGLLEPDPLTNRRDMGSDPLDYSRHQLRLVSELQKNMAEWAVEDGESYSRLRDRFNWLIYTIADASTYAGRYVGGQYFYRDHKGDPNARNPFVLVPAAKQREAMKFLADEVFSGKALNFEPALLTKLAPGRWRHWSSDDYDAWIEYNLHDRYEMIMRTALLPVFNPFTITRLHDMELMVEDGEQAYTLAEHLRSLTDTIWSELDNAIPPKSTDSSPFISSVRRGLQRAYTEQLVYYLTDSPGWLVPADANALMRMNSRQLHDRIAKISGNENLDDTSRAHLLDVQERLNKALNAEFQQY